MAIAKFKSGKSSLLKKVLKAEENKIINKAAHKALMADETKQNVTTITPAAGYSAAQNPTIRYIAHVAIGTGINQRVGQRIKIMKLRIKGSMANGSITGPAVGRLVIFYDKQNNGTLPTNAQLMADTTAATNFNSPPLITGTPRFKIIYDKSFAFNNQGGATDQSLLNVFRINKKWRNGHQIVYNTGTAATQADVEKGAFFAWFSTDAAAGAPFLAWDVELLYKDA